MMEANINTMLDKAENPRRMLRLMIQDMEDTLVEMKVSCAQAMADRARTRRSGERINVEIDSWQKRAELAVSKNREELAREALLRKREIKTEADKIGDKLQQLAKTISNQQNNIELVENKLNEAREKLREMTGDTQAQMKKDESVHPSKTDETTENRDNGEKTSELEKIRLDEEIEKELSAIKNKLNNN